MSSSPATSADSPGRATERDEPRPPDPRDDAPRVILPHEPPPQPTIPWRAARSLCRIYSSVLFDLKVFGLHHVPREGGVLLLSNHQSYFDPVLVGVRLDRPLSYMAKSELFEVTPVFTWMIRSLGAFPVRQTGSAAGAVKQAINRLKDGHALNIFPEGSRTENGEVGPMEGGAALVIRGAKVPVVPVAIVGSYQAWPRGQTAPHPHPIRLEYGPPMDLAGARSAEIMRRVDRTLRTMFEDLRSRRLRGDFR